MDYQYPLAADWSTEEIIDAVQFFENVEKAYEQGISREEFMRSYRRFKEIVPGKADEKNLCDEFEEVSGYSSYRAVKKARESEDGEKIKMN
ncbi:UPF0223 family protein [Bacillus sp. FJAT-42376]|uniref:UPF0223 family protein n=1 Tax=Bacillus sp. FJAT-42376 TaxID=2014076 RepID=UPI000F514F74|nr:UPF0223 family protein [Bacillus sp. FJAT-42376]AZB42779.1 UPF0223 family protein [Bacillus sp. FJAT-42376]